MLSEEHVWEPFEVALRREIHPDLAELAACTSARHGGKRLADFWLDPPNRHENGRAWTMIYLLAREFAAGVGLEIGTYEGTGTVCLAKGLRKVYTVDVHPDFRYRSASANPGKFVGLDIEWIIANSHDPAVLSRLPPRIDLLYIDGDHSYEGCRADWEMYTPLVSKSGLVFLDDTCNEEWPGVAQFVQEMDFAGWRKIDLSELRPNDGALLFLRD